jgi:hypothetical protein
MIFFVTLSVNGREYDSLHAEAPSAEQAGSKAVNYLKQHLGVNAQVAGVSLALRQNRKRYSDPRLIL